MQVFFCFFQKIHLIIDNIVTYIILCKQAFGKYSKNDRFCQRVQHMKYDISVKNVISEALKSERDVFFRGLPDDIRCPFSDEIKTVVFMPGAFCSDICSEFCDIRISPRDFSGLKRDIVFADIRFMGNDDFRRALTEYGFFRIAIIFPECCDSAEYGYRAAFSWIGEYRAERSDFVQLVGFVTPSYKDARMLKEMYASENSVILGFEKSPEFSVFETVSSSAKFYAAAAFAEKYIGTKSVIFLNSREEAHQFVRFLRKRRTDCVLIDGSVTVSQMKESLNEFNSGGTDILVATKAFIPSSLFYPAERVIFCGVPFSFSYLHRCILPSQTGKAVVIYSRDDIVRNEKIISSFGDALSDKAITEKRLKCLENMKNMLSANNKGE